jgi:hypothetical protein
MCSFCASWLSDAPAGWGAAEDVLANAADDRPTAVREQIPADSPTNRRRHRDRNACALFLPLGVSAGSSSFLGAESDVHVQQTLKRYLARQAPAQTLGELQGQLDVIVHYYNDIRPHRALSGHTPLQAYSARSKARPAATRPETYFRVREDRVDKTGKVSLRHDSRLYKTHRALASTPHPIGVGDDDRRQRTG